MSDCKDGIQCLLAPIVPIYNFSRFCRRSGCPRLRQPAGEQHLNDSIAVACHFCSLKVQLHIILSVIPLAPPTLRIKDFQLDFPKKCIYSSFFLPVSPHLIKLESIYPISTLFDREDVILYKEEDYVRYTQRTYFPQKFCICIHLS